MKWHFYGDRSTAQRPPPLVTMPRIWRDPRTTLVGERLCRYRKTGRLRLGFRKNISADPRVKWPHVLRVIIRQRIRSPFVRKREILETSQSEKKWAHLVILAYILISPSSRFDAVRFSMTKLNQSSNCHSIRVDVRSCHIIWHSTVRLLTYQIVMIIA